MGEKISSSRTKSSKKKRNKVSSKLMKKKTRRKESEVLHSPDSDSVSLRSKSASSTSSESDYRTRKNKSKKRRRDDSASLYSDDYSMTSASDSLSMHDNKSCKRRKALPQGRKKRTRKKIESANSDAQSRRRKRSRRRHVIKSRNKRLKKKARRHFISSLNSDSESCSTCNSRSSNCTGDGKHQRSKMTLDKNIKSSRGRDSHRALRKRKVRSPSGSSCSTRRDHDVSVDLSDETLDHDINVDRSVEALVPVDNFRRLKSVISIVNRPTDVEDYRWEKDPQKEEIICDHDDYPSPKSVDSNEGVNSKVLDDQSHGASNKRIRVENVESEVILPMKSGNIENERYNADDSRSHEVHTNSSENGKGTHVSVNFSPLDWDKKYGVGNDPELILRQKALENLRRFKGGLQATRKSINLDTKNENVNESPIKRNNNIQNKSTKPNSFLAQETDKRRRPTLPEVKKDSDAEQTTTDPLEAPVVLAVNDTNPATGEHSSKEQRDEAKNGSEFEQKTMSVMRGGEMVQVSYKVYIPKRAPALARRQLRQ